MTELKVRRRLMEDLPFYAEHCLKIRTKTPSIEPFVLNGAQRKLIAKRDEQRERTGRVRLIIPKARQTGVSTLIGADGYHQATHRRGFRVFILTHRDAATQQLFSMVHRFYEHTPENLKPKIKTANVNELGFGVLDSSYGVGTAKGSNIGRGQTINFLHWCLAKGTLLLGPDWRPVPIEEAQQVRTHTNASAPISFTSTKVAECVNVTLWGMRNLPLTCTPEHKVWTRRGWATVSSLAPGDAIGFPLLPLSPGGDRDWGRFLGLYLAEGGLKRQHKMPHNLSAVTISCHYNEVERNLATIRAVWPGEPKVEYRKNCLTAQIVIHSKDFAQRVVDTVGEDKHIPEKLGAELARGLLQGYLEGDGHWSYLHMWEATSIRPQLTFAMRDIAAALGYGWAGVDFKPAAMRYGRNEQDAWRFRLCGEGAARLAQEMGYAVPEYQRKPHVGHSEVDDKYVWVNIRSITPAGVQEVFDIEVSHTDHSYCTIHCATHNSETAFSANAADHATDLFQAVPDLPGSTIYLESTGNGVGDFFHAQTMAAMEGQSEFEVFFLPWYDLATNRLTPPSDWRAEGLFADVKKRYALDDAQVYWAFMKNRAMAVSDGYSVDSNEFHWRFRQEHPTELQDVFVAQAGRVLIDVPLVMQAMKSDIDLQEERHNPTVLGVDIGGGGDDWTWMIDRCGRVAGMRINERFKTNDSNEIANRVARAIEETNASAVCIDITGGYGSGVMALLRNRGYGDRLVGVQFAERALDPKLYVNRRAEIWCRMRDWLNAEEGARIVNDSLLLQHLTCVGYSEVGDQRVQLESKDTIRKRLKMSPDGGDALALTHGVNIARLHRREVRRRQVERVRRVDNPLDSRYL